MKKTLIQELQEYVSNDNVCYIEELADIIIAEGINTIQELQKYEGQYNTFNGQKISLNEAAQKWIETIDEDPYEYDDLKYDEIQMVKKERELMEDDSLEERILHIVKYYYYTNRDNPFPYQTFKFIIHRKL